MTTNQLHRKAVEQFKTLELKGKNVEVNKVVDLIVRDDNGKTVYYKIKATTKEDVYYGGIPISAWKYAFENNSSFIIVIAVYNQEKDLFEYKYCKPEEILKSSFLPPFRINFNLKLDGDFNDISTKLSLNDINKLVRIYNKTSK